MNAPTKELILMTLDRLLKGKVTAKEVAEALCCLIDSPDKRPEVDEEKENEMTFRDALEHLINQHSMENGSNTPDYLLADFLLACLEAFDRAVKGRDIWYHGGIHCPGEAPPTPLGKEE